MKLLTELIDTNPVQMIVEGEGEGRKHYIKGLFLEFDSPNRNKRIYRSELHDPAVKEYITEKVKGGSAWGELDHPEGPVVSLQKASHRLVEMWKDGPNWHGKAIITIGTPMGNTVKGLLESGGTLGVSSRGMGNLKQLEEGILEVQKGFKILTAGDIVSDPSAHGALVKGIMENCEYIWDEKMGWIAEEFKNKISKLSVKEIEEKKIKIFEAWLNNIKCL